MCVCVCGGGDPVETLVVPVLPCLKKIILFSLHVLGKVVAAYRVGCVKGTD